MADELDFYQDKAGDWRWRRIKDDGELIDRSTEGYKNKLDAISNANRETMLDKWTIYQDVSSQWRWNVKARNGSIVRSSIKAFSTRALCHADAKSHGYLGL